MASRMEEVLLSVFSVLVSTVSCLGSPVQESGGTSRESLADSHKDEGPGIYPLQGKAERPGSFQPGED